MGFFDFFKRKRPAPAEVFDEASAVLAECNAAFRASGEDLEDICRSYVLENREFFS